MLEMANIICVQKYRFLILVWSAMEILLFSGIVYGWASLVVVLKQEGFFYDLCERVKERKQNSTSLQDNLSCTQQDERLNLVFLSGIISFSGSGLFLGAFLDRFGLRKTRLMACALILLSSLFFVAVSKERSYLLFPGVVTLSASGIALLLSVFQIANLFDGWTSSVISLYNGSVDSSAIVLLFFKLVYDSGISLRSVFIFYFTFATITIFIFTFLLPPNVVTLTRKAVDGNEDFSLVTKECREFSTALEVSENDFNGANNEMIMKSDSTIEESRTDCIETLDTHKLSLLSSESNEGKSTEGSTSEVRLVNLMTRTDYWLITIFLMIVNLRLWFYVGSLNSYLEFMSDNNEDTVSHYTNWFGIIQFAGLLFAPFVGFVMDWKPKSKRNMVTDLGYVAAFTLILVIACIFNVLVLVPSLPIQFASFVVCVVLRAFIYASFAAFLVHKFPLSHFGKLFGATHLISATVTGSIQHGLFVIMEDILDKDPFWVNVGLLVLSLFLVVLPAYLWLVEKRKEKTYDERPSF